MSRERTPKAGVTWDRQLVRHEVYVGLDQVPTGDTVEFSDQLATPPQPVNREQRRALERAKRRKGGKR